ncbi:MAG: hypothetical protein FJ320_07040 [SAR202 cluster bacterium]|nr:hypothetical protein [SAR202 cluster bacterium]
MREIESVHVANLFKWAAHQTTYIACKTTPDDDRMRQGVASLNILANLTASVSPADDSRIAELHNLLRAHSDDVQRHLVFEAVTSIENNYPYVKNFICTLSTSATDEDYEYVMSRVYWIMRENVFTRLKSKDLL